MKKRAKKTPAPRQAKASLAPGEKLPLIEHLHELKRRLFIVAAVVAVGAAITYGLERRLIEVLLRPSHGQNFIYTSPMGGMNFLFSVCLDVGLVVATPAIIYHVLAFVQPLMRGTSRKYLLFASGATGLVAVLGVLFGYYIGLPQALHFLLHQFVDVQVKPLITIQSYMQFVALYLFGSALMFQLPLILLFINRIKPLKPSGLFKYERHLIVAAFIIAFIMNPTPNIVDQLLVVLPIIVTYQLGIGLIWMVNRGKPNQEWLQQLRAEDEQRRQERARVPLTQFMAEPLPPDPEEIELMEPIPAAVVAATVAPAPHISAPAPQPVAARQHVRPRTHTSAMASPTRRSYFPLRGQVIQ